jgi:hypothetical protein
MCKGDRRSEVESELRTNQHQKLSSHTKPCMTSLTHANHHDLLCSYMPVLMLCRLCRLCLCLRASEHIVHVCAEESCVRCPNCPNQSPIYVTYWNHFLHDVVRFGSCSCRACMPDITEMHVVCISVLKQILGFLAKHAIRDVCSLGGLHDATFRNQSSNCRRKRDSVFSTGLTRMTDYLSSVCKK